jgi:hypothetical protein
MSETVDGYVNGSEITMTEFNSFQTATSLHLFTFQIPTARVGI